jgi:hypothetical protein
MPRASPGNWYALYLIPCARTWGLLGAITYPYLLGDRTSLTDVSVWKSDLLGIVYHFFAMTSFAVTSLSAGFLHTSAHRLSRARHVAHFRPAQVRRYTKVGPSATRAGLLDGLFAPASAPSRPSGKAAELVSELLELTQGTNAGAELDAETKGQVEDLVRFYTEFLAYEIHH